MALLSSAELERMPCNVIMLVFASPSHLSDSDSNHVLKTATPDFTRSFTPRTSFPSVAEKHRVQI